jgi:RNA polymerase sigma factor (sigma-70 family)
MTGVPNISRLPREAAMKPQEPVVTDDASVIARSRQEPEVFSVLFTRHAASIQRYVTRRIGPDAADDVVAETFLLAFAQRETYDQARSHALPWLYGIATNLIGRHRRDEVRLYRALARTGVDPVTAPFTDRVDSVVTAGIAGRQLADALARMPAAYRDPLLLTSWGDLSYEETALALGIPIGTVRSRLSRARVRLRRALGGIDPTTLQESK